MMPKQDFVEDFRSTTLADVRQLGLWVALGSLGSVFWVVRGMELIERLAYYGEWAVSVIYLSLAKFDGGPGATLATFGWLSFAWYSMRMGQTIFTGGNSDRHGYKQTIFVSTLVKCFGYLLMAWFPTYWRFFTGALFLALGTAVFEPVIHGTLNLAQNRQKSSVARVGFYQTVNIGGWLGPLIALHMRQSAWSWVFYTNAVFICLNLLLLLSYKEPGIEKRLARRARVVSGAVEETSLVRESLSEFKKPHFYLYLFFFSLWWFMFPMIWDVHFKYVEDWVDTVTFVKTFFGQEGNRSEIAHFLLGMKQDGLMIEPVGIVNNNLGMIMLTCILFVGLSAKMQATTSLLIGTVFVVAALTITGLSGMKWICVAGMVTFSIREMLASPKFREFLGYIAPLKKKAMWIAFSQIPIFVGQTVEGKLDPQHYHMFSEKEMLAGKTLIAMGIDLVNVTEAALPVGEAFLKKLIEFSESTPAVSTRIFYETNYVGLPWLIFAGLGMLTVGLIWAYGKWFRNSLKTKNATGRLSFVQMIFRFNHFNLNEIIS